MVGAEQHLSRLSEHHLDRSHEIATSDLSNTGWHLPASAFECVHIAVGVEWTGVFAPITQATTSLRLSTWPPAAYVLPVGIGGALWLQHRGAQRLWGFAVGLLLFGGGLLAWFYVLPRYTSPGWLGITCPPLILVPMLWISVAIFS
jgi:hypothetical protein